MKKSTVVSLGLIILGFVLTFIATVPSSFPLQVKMGFIGKICLLVGVISFWLFAVLPYFGTKDNQKKSPLN